MTMYPQQQPWQPAVVIGDIEADADWVRTPVGVLPAAQVQWGVTDGIRIQRHTPGWAIFLALLTVWFFLLGLLLFLMKEERRFYQVAVTVTGGGLSYTAHLESWDYPINQDVRPRVGYAHAISGR